MAVSVVALGGGDLSGSGSSRSSSSSGSSSGSSWQAVGSGD